MFEKVYKILSEFLGESKQGGYDPHCDQYQFNCPHCAEENGGIPDGKHNLEVLLSPKKMVFQCWKCAETDSMKGSIGYLIKRFGGKRLYIEYKEEIKSLQKRSLYVLENWDDAPIENFENYLTLPKTYSKIHLEHSLDKRLVEYLKKRKITQDIIDKFNIGYTSWENENTRWSNRIIIPSFDQFGDLNYWVGRDFTGKSYQKYCNCDADKKQIIFQESLIDWDSPIYLVEGCIDCLYLPNSIALMGKTLSKESLLFQTLVKKANSEVVICLDNDTKEFETKKIYSLLNFGRLKGKIRYIRMGEEKTAYKDFGEAYEKGEKKELINLIKNKKSYTEFDLIW